jgi:AraC-like DNA-binding protein
MPSSFVQTFTDPDELTEAVRGAAVEFTVTERGNYSATLSVIDLGTIWLQHLSTDLARTFQIEFLQPLANVTIQTEPGPSQVRNGIEYGFTDMSRSDRGHRDRSAGRASTGSVKIPLVEIDAIGRSLLGQDLTSLSDAQTITPPPDAVARLRRLYGAALDLAKDAPAVLSHREASRGLEQAVIEALMDCFGRGEVHEDRTAQRHHAAIMRRFHRVVDQHLEEPLYLPELCREIGASMRTLNACCHEHLGMGPKHYLLLRRMHLVRRALRENVSADTTVTEVATRFGFWQFGRFAVEYKALFRESPSTTLARPRLSADPDAVGPES